MKYLEIENNKGYYHLNSKKTEIDKISKEDILELVKILMHEKVFLMDEFSEEKLQHGVHKIIYRNIHNKFQDLKNEKDSIIDEVNQDFQEAFQKYS
ncbi:hypothetical protein [Carnobacterium sp. ISL-102]|uniref:hypothetical protein n=1 Tax=Carnobacterium sp. ISL-102 TaxID=2819142 RepID=UPI001BE79912|nr:hypothetical protein [Carnobacterium sp. ISL-102]MBT2732900.1 hypothetical protein [Carnobacterium sp. ISL-102]